eukprot:10007483-Heterocapsa_arctica.AAC.1
MDAAVHVKPMDLETVDSRTVSMAWSDRPGIFLVRVSQHQESSAGIAIPSSRVDVVGEVWVFDVPSIM